MYIKAMEREIYIHIKLLNIRITYINAYYIKHIDYIYRHAYFIKNIEIDAHV